MAKIKIYLDQDGDWWVRRGKIIRLISMTSEETDGGPRFGVQYQFTSLVRERFGLKQVRRPGSENEFGLMTDDDGHTVIVHRASGQSAWPFQTGNECGTESLNWFTRPLRKIFKSDHRFKIKTDGSGRPYVLRKSDGWVSLLRLDDGLTWVSEL
jgi:hypothetical protein